MSQPYPNFGEPLPGGHSQFQLDMTRKRCWQSRSDEEIEAWMDTRNLHYRQGWPQLPPLPVDTITNGARDGVDNLEDDIEKVLTLCVNHDIQPSDIFFAFRVPKVQQPGERYHTLVVTADLNGNPILVRLIIAIRKYLQQNPRYEETAIEIIDEYVVHGLFSFPIPPSEKRLLDIWDLVFDIALEEIHSQKEQWITIEMLYRGSRPDAAQCQETVVISAPSAAKDIWITTILPNVRRRVRPIHSSLAIELLCGSSIDVASRGKKPRAEIYSPRVPMGSSIGQSQLEKQSGTAGGMVKLSNSKTYALTNHHVVRNEKLDDLLKNKRGDPPKPLPPTTDNSEFDATEHGVTCPSNEDNTAFIAYCNGAVKVWNDRPYSPERSQQLKFAQDQLRMAMTTNRDFGTIYASSGLRTVRCSRFSSNAADGSLAAETGGNQYRFLLDWSLLEMAPNRVMTNNIPMLEQEEFGFLLPNMLCSKWTVMNNPKCSIAKDEVRVGKYGRTTGFTHGKINGVCVIINPEMDSRRYEFMSKTYGLTVEDCGHSMSFIAPARENAVQLGDSGSIVLHGPSGDWLGLIFGETGSGAALFTPIDLVLRDIEKVTGQKVIEPVFNPV